MIYYKPIFAVFPPCSEEELRSAFAQYQFKAILEDESNARGSSLAAAKGLEINPVHTFADRQVAETLIQTNAKRGGPAVAVRLVQRDPQTQMLIVPETGERRVVWLVGANCPVYEEAI